MNRPLLLLAIGLVFGGAAGFILAASNGITLDGHDHAEHDHSEILEVSEGAAPGLSISVVKDPDAGWNLFVDAENFRFAPANVGKTHVPGEGHAPVYVNGTKVARIYGPWYHISALPEGEAQVRVTLNSNDHKALALGGKPLEAAVTVQN